MFLNQIFQLNYAYQNRVKSLDQFSHYEPSSYIKY